ncbi:hypothetical protein PMAYCL1PPCAC_12290, partial [Pristionchus mayeri]
KNLACLIHEWIRPLSVRILRQCLSVGAERIAFSIFGDDVAEGIDVFSLRGDLERSPIGKNHGFHHSTRRIRPRLFFLRLVYEYGFSTLISREG